MPFVNIHLSESLGSEICSAISQAVHESLMIHFQVPPNDYFHVIHAIAAGNMKYPSSYLGVSHRDPLIFIYITCGIGRTKEMKKALYSSIASLIDQRTILSASDVIIVLCETALENWSFGEGIAQMIEK